MTTPSLDISGAIARITLQRPEAANKLAPEDITALRAHLREINAADGVRVLILQSAGKHFCSGHDLAELAAKARGVVVTLDESVIRERVATVRETLGQLGA